VGPPQALDATIRLAAALGALAGAAPVERLAEAQTLLRALIDACGMRQGEIALRIGVHESVVSQWRTGGEAPGGWPGCAGWPGAGCAATDERNRS
jgi:hypothetical protein